MPVSLDGLLDGAQAVIPRPGECHVWQVPVAPSWDLPNVLDSQEQEQYAKFVRSADRRRYLTSHVATRVLIGHYLAVDPGRVRFDRTCQRCGRAHGKPVIRAPGTSLQFSLSHSGDWIMVALAGVPVGVDIQEIDGRTDIDSLAPQVFSATEHRWYERLPPDRRRWGFFVSWARKEAVLKATGDGLGVPMPDLHLGPPGRPAQLLGWLGRRLAAPMRLADLDPGPGYTAAVALLSHLPVQVRTFPAG